MRRERKRVALPPLAFGDARAVCTTDAVRAEEQTAKAHPSLNYLRPFSDSDPFFNKGASVTINGLTLVATSSVAVRLDVGETQDFHLIVPFAGRTTIYANSKRYDWSGGEQAVLFAQSNRRTGTSETRSLLMAHLDKKILRNTIATMMGAPEADRSLRTEGVQLLDLRFGGINFMELFHQLCRQIDLLSENPAVLKSLRIDDQFYRCAAMLMNPAAFLDDTATARATGGGDSIDLVCDAVRSAPFQALSLTEMEALSGMSARALQYAFKKRFGQSPLNWQQSERLHLAHGRLARNDVSLGITELALELGFSSHSRFSAFYRRMFGETPSTTLENARVASVKVV